jgi:hypothetical protein
MLTVKVLLPHGSFKVKRLKDERWKNRRKIYNIKYTMLPVSKKVLIGYDAFGDLIYSDTPKNGPLQVQPSNYNFMFNPPPQKQTLYSRRESRPVSVSISNVVPLRQHHYHYPKAPQ